MTRYHRRLCSPLSIYNQLLTRCQQPWHLLSFHLPCIHRSEQTRGLKRGLQPLQIYGIFVEVQIRS
jgi:hypothetical protein